MMMNINDITDHNTASHVYNIKIKTFTPKIFYYYEFVHF